MSEQPQGVPIEITPQDLREVVQAVSAVGDIVNPLKELESGNFCLDLAIAILLYQRQGQQLVSGFDEASAFTYWQNMLGLVTELFERGYIRYTAPEGTFMPPGQGSS